MGIPISLVFERFATALLGDKPWVTNFLVGLHLHQVVKDLTAVLTLAFTGVILAIVVGILCFCLESHATTVLDHVIIFIVISIHVSTHAVLVVENLAA